jgi:hypothetical protein
MARFSWKYTAQTGAFGARADFDSFADAKRWAKANGAAVWRNRDGVLVADFRVSP